MRPRRIALASPADVAAELASKVAEFLATPFQWRLPFKARDLIVHLVGGGEIAAALGLLRPVVTPTARQGDGWRSAGAPDGGSATHAEESTNPFA